MSKSKLTDDQKDHIVECYRSGSWNQQQLADLYKVSRKTVYRVLKDAGLITEPLLLDPGSARIVEVAKAHGLDAQTLHQALNAPALTRENIILTLANHSLGDIHKLLQEVFLVKHKALQQKKEILDDQQPDPGTEQRSESSSHAFVSNYGLDPGSDSADRKPDSSDHP